LTQLLRGDRLIGSRSDPGARHAPEPLLLERGDDALHTPVLLNEGIHHGRHLRPDDPAQQSIEESHGCLLEDVRAPQRSRAIVPQSSRRPQARRARVRSAQVYYIITTTLKNVGAERTRS